MNSPIIAEALAIIEQNAKRMDLINVAEFTGEPENTKVLVYCLANINNAIEHIEDELSKIINKPQITDEKK